MFLTKRPNGYYSIVLNNNGKRQFVSTKTKNKSKAIEFLRAFNTERHGKEIKKSKVGFSDFILDFLEYSKTRHARNTTETFRYVLNTMVNTFSDMPLQEITERQIEGFFVEKQKNLQPATIRKYYGILCTVMETAKRWKYIERNPLRDMTKPKLPERLPAFFIREDFSELIQHITDGNFKELVYFALFTGARLGEIVSLRWESIDLQRRIIRIENTANFQTKSKRNRVIPINDSLHSLLTIKRETARGATVFEKDGKPYLSGYVSHRFKKYVRKAGLSERLHFHSLRHSFASWLAQDGASLYEIQKLLGHADAKTSMIYATLQPEQLHSTVNKINL